MRPIVIPLQPNKLSHSDDNLGDPSRESSEMESSVFHKRCRAIEQRQFCFGRIFTHQAPKAPQKDACTNNLIQLSEKRIVGTVVLAITLQSCGPGRSTPGNQANSGNVNQAKISATAPECDPNYSGCVPIASDVDCEGGHGDGPAYVKGPVRVIGRDIYGLDRDGDGIGCE